MSYCYTVMHIPYKRYIKLKSKGLSTILYVLVACLYLLYTCRKQLFNKVHYFVHLNLSISLLLAYFVFVVGIETAVGNRVTCNDINHKVNIFFLTGWLCLSDRSPSLPIPGSLLLDAV